MLRFVNTERSQLQQQLDTKEWSHHSQTVERLLDQRAKNEYNITLNPLLMEQAGKAVQSAALEHVARRKLRAFRYNHTYAILPSLSDIVDVLLEYGLTIQDVAEIFKHTPSVALMRPRRPHKSLEQRLDQLLTLLKGNLGLRHYDARKVIRRGPGLLTQPQQATQVVNILNRLGVSSNSLARDKNAIPVLLSRQPRDVFRLVAILASDAIRMPLQQIGPLLRRSPELLDNAAINNNDTFDNMLRTAWTLRYEIGTPNLGKIIAAYPQVLLLNVETQIMPNAKYLMELLEDDLVRVLSLYPALLGVPLEDLQATVAYWRDELELDQEIPLMIRSFPALLTKKPAEMQVGVDFLRKEIGVTNVGRFVSRLPPILTAKVAEDLQPRWQFLQSRMRDARWQVTRFPAYFSYPTRVIYSRFDYLQSKEFPISLVNLDDVLRFGDDDFCRKIARDANPNAYREFCAQHYPPKSKSKSSKSSSSSPRRRKAKST